jgi:diguanylate cyclase (GGDEF)-like protein
MRRVLHQRSPELLSLVALYTVSAVCLGLGVLFPMSAQAPIRLGYGMIAYAVVVGAGLLALGPRVPRQALLGAAVVAVLCDSLLIANAHTPAGAIVDALAYGWLVSYVAIFFPGAVLPFAALVAAGFGVGLMAAALPGLTSAWAIISITAAGAGMVLARVSVIVQRSLQTDVLTGALNRSGLHAVGRRERREGQTAVAAIDLDFFRTVNSREGHSGGDRLLAEAAAAWRRALRGQDVLARTGGDEFVLIMPGTSTEEAAGVLARLRAAHPVAWSAGVASWRPGETLEASLERADQRLYAAKAARG